MYASLLNTVIFRTRCVFMYIMYILCLFFFMFRVRPPRRLLLHCWPFILRACSHSHSCTEVTWQGVTRSSGGISSCSSLRKHKFPSLALMWGLFDYHWWDPCSPFPIYLFFPVAFYCPCYTSQSLAIIISIPIMSEFLVKIQVKIAIGQINKHLWTKRATNKGCRFCAARINVLSL